MADAEAPDSDADAQAKADLAEVPRIPYARGLKLSTRDIMRILMLLGTLVMVLVMTGPCSQAVSGFIGSFDLGSGAAVGSNAVHLPAGMTDQQIKQRIDQARGSAAPDPAPAPATGAQ